MHVVTFQPHGTYFAADDQDWVESTDDAAQYDTLEAAQADAELIAQTWNLPEGTTVQAVPVWHVNGLSQADG